MKAFPSIFRVLLATAIAVWLSACASSKQALEPLPTPDQVELERFMGAWYVHGYTPILVDKTAHNAVEHYFLDEKGRVKTTYAFRKDAFDGKLKTYTPVGFPLKDDPSGARWKMQFIWPFKADYVIVHLSEDYQQTIIGHPKRKYAWIMTRDTAIDDADYAALLAILAESGYDTDIIRRLPHDWSKDQPRLQRIQKVGSSAPLGKK